MIALERDGLEFRFPEVHEDAVLRVVFQRTLRIPDDGRVHLLPPGLGAFPLRHVDDFARRVPPAWAEHGGVMLPIHQAEAVWIAFSTVYPMVVKVGAGKVDAVSGEAWSEALSRSPKQNYLVVPDQPWLDGYCTDTGVIRQFVAMRLGAGFSPEEQLTGKAEVGGIQLQVHPLRREVWLRMLEERDRDRRDRTGWYVSEGHTPYSAAPDMALGMGGRMKQEIYEDSRPAGDWDTDQRERCFVHLANSATWRSITGTKPPTRPPTAAAYRRAGLPWFDFYNEGASPVAGSPTLAALTSITMTEDVIDQPTLFDAGTGISPERP